MSASFRLDRLLANMGYGSRREVQQLVRAGGVTLDGGPGPGGVRDSGSCGEQTRRAVSWPVTRPGARS